MKPSKKMKRILVPTNFSEGSNNAFKYALEFADTIGARITLYHVYNGEAIHKNIPMLLQEALETEDEEKALEEFEKFGKLFQQELGIEVPSRFILERGTAVNQIVEYADFMDADLIVMGTWWARGASGMVDTWIGNVGTKVVDRTLRPVLLIPRRASFKKLNHLAYATNFREKDQRIPQELTELSKSFDLDLSCLHVKRPGSSYNEIQYAFLREMYRLELDNFHIYFYTLTDENVIEALNLFVQKEEVDILALLKHEKLSVFERILNPDIPQIMAFHTKTPLLILHEGYQ